MNLSTRYCSDLRSTPIAELLDMIERRGALLMRSGGCNFTPPNGSGIPLTKDEIAQMRRLASEGKTANYIARVMGRSGDCVRHHTREIRAGKPRAKPELR